MASNSHTDPDYDTPNGSREEVCNYYYLPPEDDCRHSYYVPPGEDCGYCYYEPPDDNHVSDLEKHRLKAIKVARKKLYGKNDLETEERRFRQSVHYDYSCISSISSLSAAIQKVEDNEKLLIRDMERRGRVCIVKCNEIPPLPSCPPPTTLSPMDPWYYNSQGQLTRDPYCTQGDSNEEIFSSQGSIVSSKVNLRAQQREKFYAEKLSHSFLLHQSCPQLDIDIKQKYSQIRHNLSRKLNKSDIKLSKPQSSYNSSLQSQISSNSLSACVGKSFEDLNLSSSKQSHSNSNTSLQASLSSTLSHSPIVATKCAENIPCDLKCMSRSVSTTSINKSDSSSFLDHGKPDTSNGPITSIFTASCEGRPSTLIQDPQILGAKRNKPVPAPRRPNQQTGGQQYHKQLTSESSRLQDPSSPTQSVQNQIFKHETQSKPTNCATHKRLSLGHMPMSHTAVSTSSVQAHTEISIIGKNGRGRLSGKPRLPNKPQRKDLMAKQVQTSQAQLSGRPQLPPKPSHECVRIKTCTSQPHLHVNSHMVHSPTSFKTFIHIIPPKEPTKPVRKSKLTQTPQSDTHQHPPVTQIPPNSKAKPILPPKPQFKTKE